MAWLARRARGQGILRIKLKHSETREETDLYFVHPLATDFGGLAFRLERYDLPGQGHDAGVHVAYDVHLAQQGTPGSCECKGFLRHHHCKHIDALQALAASGRL
jgi:hypothetical protein